MELDQNCKMSKFVTIFNNWESFEKTLNRNNMKTEMETSDIFSQIIKLFRKKRLKQYFSAVPSIFNSFCHLLNKQDKKDKPDKQDKQDKNKLFTES